MSRIAILLYLISGALSASDMLAPFKGKKSGKLGVVKVLREFTIPKDLDLSLPLDLNFSADNTLVYLDEDSSRIHHWDGKDQYQGSFAGEGQGPGEMENAIMVAAGKEYVYCFQWSGRINAYARSGPNAYTNEHTAIKSFTHGMRPFAFKAVVLPDGRERLLIVSQTEDRSSPIITHLFDFATGAVEEIKALRTTTPLPLQDIARMDDPTIKLALGQPRPDLVRLGKGWLFGFSDDPNFIQLDSNLRLLNRFKHELPKFEPTEEDRESFLDTPLAVVGSMRKLEKTFGWKTKFQMDRPMSSYAHMATLGTDHLLLFSTAVGSFEFCGYMTGKITCSLYDWKKREILARGQLSLDDGRLFSIDDQLVFARYNEADVLEVRTVLLGWAEQ